MKNNNFNIVLLWHVLSCLTMQTCVFIYFRHKITQIYDFFYNIKLSVGNIHDIKYVKI
jgi:hypothetical protein